MTRKSAAPSTLRWINLEMHLQLSLIISKNYPEEKKIFPKTHWKVDTIRKTSFVLGMDKKEFWKPSLLKR